MPRWPERSVVQRFFDHVEVTEACWFFRGATVKGYARFYRSSLEPVYAHRFAYELLVGPIPKGYDVDHLCFEPACVNPDHLQALTASENRSRQRKTFRTSCGRGHAYDDVNTHWVGGKRVCRKCRYLRKRKSVLKQREAQAFPGSERAAS